MTGILNKLNSTIRYFIEKDEKLPKHLTQSIALEELALPHLMRVGVGIIGSLLVIFIIWSAFTKVEEVASAAGQVIPNSHVQTIQHLEGGIVKEIMVHDGDIVEKDQPLLKLDETNAQSDLGQILARKKALSLETDRLRKFAGIDVKENLELTEDENSILTSMEDARSSQRNILNDQLAQKEKQFQAISGMRSTLEKNVELMQKEATIKRKLASQGYGSELMALNAERELNDMQGKLEEALNQEHQAQDAIKEMQSRLISLNADLKQDAMKNLGQKEAELAQVKESLEKLQSTASRTIITSPVRGVIKGLAINTLGAVIESGKILMEIVPIEKELLIEAMVLPSDVGHLQVGQIAKIKVSAYEFSRYGTATGKLENISATTFQTQDGHSFYKAKIKLDKNYVGHNPQQNLILPGMTVQADIITGDRTILQYLLKPIHIAMETAFREH